MSPRRSSSRRSGPPKGLSGPFFSPMIDPSIKMKRRVALGMACWAVLAGSLAGCRRHPQSVPTIGIFQITDAPTLNQVRKGFIKALLDGGIKEGADVRLVVRNAMGDVTEARRIARDFVRRKTDLIAALSTQCLQAAIMAGPKVPVIFASVANPQLLGVGKPGQSGGQRITGVASTAPIEQTLAFIREGLPKARRMGTVWTPAELNSEYYLGLLREGAAKLGFEVTAVPVANINEVFLSGQMLLSKKVDVIFPISDNTVNASFESLGRLARDNAVPLIGGSPLLTRLGACAAMGWDFFEMGYKAGHIAARVMKGEEVSRIPIQTMTHVRLHLNLEAARRQGVEFSPPIIERADEIIGLEGVPPPQEQRP